ncbi:effector-associated constant component EACC1 [Streptomyces sp. IBSBF 2390]|uniref:effector-associated constant component EACC1 n=1 Tax=Streptomyces sp. IBSBF 2390 TaxID=2903533 RepID=UPI002FDC3B40
MHVLVEVEGRRREEELRSLQEWLRREPAVSRSASTSLLEGPTQPGYMGSLVDALELVTGNGWSAASFALSLAAWRQTRPRAPKVTIRRGDVEVTLVDGTEEEVRLLVTLLEQPDDTSQQAP